MPALFEYPLTVRPEDIDAHGHANNAVYLVWLQKAAGAHSAAQGWPGERYRTAQIGWFARKHIIEYLRPVYAGEQLVIRTWVATLERVTSQRKYEIWRIADNRLIVQASTDWTFVDLSTGRPKRITPEVISAFEIYTPPPPVTPVYTSETTPPADV